MFMDRKVEIGPTSTKTSPNQEWNQTFMISSMIRLKLLTGKEDQSHTTTTVMIKDNGTLSLNLKTQIVSYNFILNSEEAQKE